MVQSKVRSAEQLARVFAELSHRPNGANLEEDHALLAYPGVAGRPVVDLSLADSLLGDDAPVRARRSVTITLASRQARWSDA